MNTSDDHDPSGDLITEQLDLYYERISNPSFDPQDDAAELTPNIAAKDVEKFEKAKRCLELLARAAGKRSSTVEHEEEKHSEESPPLDSSISGLNGDAVRHIDRFEIRSTLGAGGFGIVYRAFDPVTKRDVALKIPRMEVLASDELRQRFELEASAAAKLDHPNIIPVLEAGMTDLVPFIVSPYFVGPTLGDWLRESKEAALPNDAAVLVRQLANAVQHAHDRGVLHRDIKPSNVLLADVNRHAETSELSTYAPKLMDFGLAKLSDASTNMTQSGAILGTVRYMAPEQARGDQRAVTTASDVYSLGAIFFELLSGRPPFEGTTDIDILRKVAMDEPTRIRSIRQLVPADLETICLKCLEKDPARRYRSAGELAAELDRYLVGEPILARPVGPLVRIAKWAYRRPAMAGLISLAAISLVTLTTLSLWYNAQLARSLERTKASEQHALSRERAARQLAYCADMRLIDERWSNSSFGQLKTVLDRYVPDPDEPDIRGFEWWLYWHALMSDRKWHKLGEHAGGVTAVAMKNDSTMAASAGSDGVVRLWEIPSGREIAELRGHKADDVDGLAFSPDGALLASGSNDGEVRLWRTSPPKLHSILRDHTDWVSSVAFSPDGKLLASAGGDHKIVLWDIERGEKKTELTGHTETVRSVVFLKKRPLLFSSSEDATVRAWNLQTFTPAKELIDPIPEKTRWIRQLVVEPDETGLWGIVFHAAPVIWDLRDRRFGAFHRRVGSLNADPICIAFRRTHPHAEAIFGFENSAIVGSLEHFDKSNDRYIGHSSAVRSLASGDTTRWMISGADGAAYLWDIEFQPRSERLITLDTSIVSACVSPNGDRVWICRQDGVAAITDFDTVTSFVASCPIQAQPIWAVTADSQAIWVACGDGHLRRLSSDNADVTADIRLAPGIQRLRCSPDGRWLLAIYQDKLILVDCEAPDGQRTLNDIVVIRDAEFIDTSTIACACEDGNLRLWKVSTFQACGTVQLSPTTLDTVARLPDGKIAVGGYQTVWILERSFAVVATLPHYGNVGWLTCAGEGKSLLTRDERSNRIWNTTDWQEVAIQEPVIQRLSNSVSQDGFRMATNVGDEYLRLFDFRPISR